MRVSYINGAYVNHADAMTHIEDRGYQFADGVYEYFAFYSGEVLDLDPHLARLARSLAKIRIEQPMSQAALKLVMRELMERNGRADGGIYLQVTRGIARRDHAFPKDARPVLSMTICGPKTPKPHEIRDGVRVITRPDDRWKHCDIKSIALLANILAKQEAAAAGAREVWLTLPDGTVTEGSACNAFIVNQAGELLTHPADHHVLPGITRDVVLRLARQNGIAAVERPFTLNEVYAAAEAFITSTSPNVLPVVKIEDKTIGSGAPGPVTRRLMALYDDHIKAQVGRSLLAVPA